ncbi:transcription termination factor MTERF15, mitochondrial-like isoform X2 [Pyrus x bretschneideri]|uniref:transcription termination factor MTERF15, mitochondrial-like isoform X2 n=1 Tax=Pyrus x bretschneideri TaxID=225117 RepID=UPI00202F8FE6|nr:transcription termination factor MTERF15, mitochondrial-like isoform X2 [Pyrus x bretschneideri]
MAALFNLKAGRLGRSLFSKTKRFVLGDVKPPHCTLQCLILCRHLASEISETQSNFTVSYLINSCGLSPKGAISTSKRVKLRSLERADSVLALLRDRGFSATQISKLVRSCPQLLVTKPEKTLLPKLEFFTSLGASKDDLAKFLAFSPAVLGMSLQERIKPTCHFLRKQLSEKKLVVFLKRGGPRIFLEGHSKNVAPNIEILRESAIKALCSSNSKSIWNRNSEVYKRWGWSENDVLSAFKRFPQCMTMSEKKVMQVMEFLVNKMEWPAGVINKYPIIVAFGLEKRIIPRCLVVKVLMVKGFIKEIENVSLCSVMCPAEKCFLAKFVARYIDEVPALLSVYQGKVEVQDA